MDENLGRGREGERARTMMDIGGELPLTARSVCPSKSPSIYSFHIIQPASQSRDKVWKEAPYLGALSWEDIPAAPPPDRVSGDNAIHHINPESPQDHGGSGFGGLGAGEGRPHLRSSP